MSITDELREWAHGFNGPWRRNEEMLLAIADRIDAEHERELRETDEDIVRDVRHEWVRLPLDADGKPINIGDVMEWPDGETFEVVGIGQGTLFYVDGDGGALADWTHASTKRHHHAPTVEDVLREFANEVYADADNEIRDRDFLCAKYAKRLTLAESEDA